MRGTSYASWRVRRLVVALAAAGGACGPSEPTPVIYPSTTEAARRTLELEFVRSLAVSPEPSLRPDERGAVASDPARGLIYAGGRDGALLALESDRGEVVWEHKFSGAIGSEPLLLAAEGVLLVGTANGVLTALDLERRAPRWAYETQGTIMNRPLVAEGVVYFANSRDQVFALDVRTGAWRWQYEQPFAKDFTVQGRAGLAYVDDIDPTIPEGGMIITGFDSGKVVAIGASSGEPLWITSVAATAETTFIDADGTPWVDRAQGVVVVSGHSTGVYGLGLVDGQQRWFRPVRGASSVVGAADGALVFSSSLEGLFALEPGGRLRWRQQHDPGVLSTPLIVDDVVYVGHSESGLWGYDLNTGELLARLDVGSGVSGQPVYDPATRRLFAISNRALLLVYRVVGGVLERS